MRRKVNRSRPLMVALLTTLLCGAITVGPSIAETITYTDMGYTLTDLGTLGGVESTASFLNKKGEVLGQSYTGDFIVGWHAFLYSDGTMTDLNLGESSDDVEPFAITEKGWVIGMAYPVGHAFLYGDGVMTDLGQVVSDLFLLDSFSLADKRYFSSALSGNNLIGVCDWGWKQNACILTVPNK